VLSPGKDKQQRAECARRLVILDLLAGDRGAAARHLRVYREAGGTQFPAADIPGPPAGGDKTPTIEIPGPLRSFSRMAALSPSLAPANILPALARNVITSGYRVSASYEVMQPTEYMKLLLRYLSQARELEKLAGEDGVISIESCDSTQTADLLRVLGYRMRGGCGSEVILETVNAARAFLTIDSGFPLAELEQALRTNRPFRYDYRPTKVPVLYDPGYWLSERDKKRHPAFIDAFLADPSLCRLYLAMSKLDRETASALRGQMPVEKLKAFAHVLDFYGGMFAIRDGTALVPGGQRSAAMWRELVGVPPSRGAAFYERLVGKDDGWMASYYDALMRINGPVQDYLSEPQRLKRFYLAIRGRVTSPGPARPVFRANADMMLLTSRLRLEPDGTPHIPGGLEVWKRVFAKSRDEVYDRKLKRVAPTWTEPDDVVEALFALCRKSIENQPLKVFMALSDVNRHRAAPLQPATVERLIESWEKFGAQYPIFAESGALSDQTILSFLDTAEGISRIGNRLLRADAAGTMQALVGLWQIFVRNGSIPAARADATLAGILQQFGKPGNRRELFDRAMAGVRLLLANTGAPAGASAQDYLLSLLTGAARAADEDSHRRLVEEMMRIFEAQKLISLDTIIEVADHLEALAGGAELNTAIFNRLEERIAELQPRREGLSAIEKNAISFGYWSERHIDQERKMRLLAQVRRALGSPEKLRNLREELAPILRDTLVGLNYIHYAPPGAQLLLTNPLFVRSHDFLGMAGTSETWQRTEVYATGWPSSAGGRLVGSLSGLAYALAQAEQNFLVPQTEQALIWTDLVPQMILAAKVPRWWNVTPPEMHWVALHMRLAKSALAEAVLDPRRREEVLAALEQQASPARVRRVSRLLAQGDVPAALDQVTPAELFVMGKQLVSGEPASDVLAGEIRRLAAADPDHINHETVSRAFGSPKPTLANCYRPELLNLRTFPTLMGYSSRVMAESWESNALYFAALADELYLRPSRLNVAVPEWTKRTVETLFATHLEDWPAVLRALRGVGDRLRAEMRKRENPPQRVALGR